MKVSDLVPGRRINPRGEIEYDEDEKERYVGRFRKAFDADVEEDVKAKLVYEVHLEIRSNYDLYIAVADALGSYLKRAIRTYIEQHRGNLANPNTDGLSPGRR